MAPVALAQRPGSPAFADERACVLAPAPGDPRVASRDEVTPLLPSVPSVLQRRRDDAWLAARVGRHLPDSFDVLFERHWAHLRTYCLGVLGSADEAQDAAQEAMTRTYRRLWRTKDVPPFKALLFAIARNTCIDRLRERSRSAGPVQEHHLPAAAGADEIATGRGDIDLLVADLRALSERQRTALVLRTACDLSHEEIAATLQTTPAKVKSLISEARQALEQRRTGHALSCEEYRRGVQRVRGRVRNQTLLAHRSTCACCGEHPMPHLALGLPALALTWMLRRARDLAGTTTAPATGSTVAKLAVAVACIGTAAIPAGQALDRGDDAPSAALAASATHAPAPEDRRDSAGTDRRATPRAARIASGPAIAPAGSGAERRHQATARIAPPVDRPAIRDDQGNTHDIDERAPATLPTRLRTTVTPIRETIRDLPRPHGTTTRSMRRAMAPAAREVARIPTRVTSPTPAVVDATPGQDRTVDYLNGM